MADIITFEKNGDEINQITTSTPTTIVWDSKETLLEELQRKLADAEAQSAAGAAIVAAYAEVITTLQTQISEITLI